MPPKEKPSCPVCMTHFTTVIRQPIQCSFCPHAACRQCTSQFLLTTQNDSHCMECKREWNREFIDTNLTQTFRKGALKLHRRRILMDRERGRLPAMQVFVEAQTTISRNVDQIAQLRVERKRLKTERNQIQAGAAAISFDELSRQLAPIHKHLAEKKILIKRLDRELWTARALLTGEEKPEAREFIMKCPAEECRGFLSSGWKCGTCEKFFCSECHAQKAGQRDESHVCNEDAKATAAMIRKETKPCPKCGIRISKIDGCDQMWCTGCHTTFSWNTGQILLNTVVHNPHYYEYLRKANGGAIPREAGDVPCGGLPNGYLFTRIVSTIPNIDIAIRTTLYSVHRCLSDVLYVRLPQFPLRAPANDNRDLDIAYLMQKITEEEWATKLEQTETRFERKKEIGLILQTFVHIGSEKLTQLQNQTTQVEQQKLAQNIVKEMDEVRDYVNKSLLAKGIQMGMVVPQFDQSFYYRWATRDQIREGKIKKGAPANEAEGEEAIEGQEDMEGSVKEIPAANVIVQPPAPAPIVRDTGSEIVSVDIDGEMVQMTRRQAMEILNAH
jgi:hypothetical protein